MVLPYLRVMNQQFQQFQIKNQAVVPVLRHLSPEKRNQHQKLLASLADTHRVFSNKEVIINTLSQQKNPPQNPGLVYAWVIDNLHRNIERQLQSSPSDTELFGQLVHIKAALQLWLSQNMVGADFAHLSWADWLMTQYCNHFTFAYSGVRCNSLLLRGWG